MKVLFLMDSPEYLRFYDSVVEELASRGHTVAIAVNNQREKKPVGAEGLNAYADRVRVLGVVPESTGVWGDVAYALRGTMDFVRFLHPTFVNAPALRARMKRKVLPRGYRWLDSLSGLSAENVSRVERALMAVDRAVPIHAPILEFLRSERPDVLLVSPLVAAASDQVDWIKAAQRLGIRSAACIASWDNLTNKGLMRIEPERVLVWNDAQRREAVTYHYVRDTRVEITGAQLFDKWFTKRPTRERQAFCANAGLPDDRPFVLFTGSSSFISESSAEVAFVRRWIDALRNSGDPTLREVNILVRPHPYNFHRWADRPVADCSGVSVFPREPYNPIEPASRDDFFDTLYHCAAVVGINTSAMIEAAIVGKPVCSLLAQEFAGTQEGTIHFHHLLPENGGFVRIASTLDEHAAQLAGCLRDPAQAVRETSGFIASFIRPHGSDRPATPIFVDAVERLAAAAAPAPVAPPFWRHLVRPLVLVFAAPILVGPGAWGRMRKRLDGRMRSYRKRVMKRGASWKRYLGLAR